MEGYSVSRMPKMYRPSSSRCFRPFSTLSTASTPALLVAHWRSGNGSSSRMTQQEGQEESDQQEYGDVWRGAGNSRCRVPDPFRGQKTDHQRAVHRVTLSHQESMTSTSVPREIIRTLYALGGGQQLLDGCIGSSIRKAPGGNLRGPLDRYPLTGDRKRKGKGKTALFIAV